LAYQGRGKLNPKCTEKKECRDNPRKGRVFAQRGHELKRADRGGKASFDSLKREKGTQTRLRLGIGEKGNWGRSEGVPQCGKKETEGN